MRTSPAILLAYCFLMAGAQAQGFKFSNPTPEAQADAAAKAAAHAHTPATGDLDPLGRDFRIVARVRIDAWEAMK